MIRSTLYTHQLETDPTYRQIRDDNTFFIYGEGPQKCFKKAVKEIPAFKYKGSEFSLSNLIDFVITNKEYTLDYIKEYGYRVVADQLNITYQDVATLKNWNFLKDIEKHPNLINYLIEVKTVYSEFIYLMKKENISVLDYFINEFTFDKFCFFDWMVADWSIYILSTSNETPFTYILDKYDEHHNLNDYSIKNTLNHLSKGDLGDRIENVLAYSSYLKNSKTPLK